MWSRVVFSIFCLWPFHSMGGEEQPLPPLAAVAALDVPRYLGTWYEIAKYPNFFQKNCAADTYAELIEKNLQVIDGTAGAFARDNNLQVAEACLLPDPPSSKL